MSSPSAPPDSIFAPLQDPVYRRLWQSSIIASLGGLIYGTSAAWHMTTLGVPPHMVALIQTATMAPGLVFSLGAGILADRLDRRHILIAAQALMCVTALSVALFIRAGLMTPALLLGGSFLIGSGTALREPAWQSTIGQLVPRRILPSAVALNGISYNLARSVGPAIGGMLIAVVGAFGAFLFSAAAYLPMLAVLIWRGPPRRVRKPAAGPIDFRGILATPGLRSIMARCLLYCLLSSGVLPLLPLVIHDELRGGSFLYGLALGAMGVGAVSGALLIGRLRSRFDNETMIRGGFLAYGLCGLVCAHGVVGTLAGMALAGASTVVTFTIFNSQTQLRCEPEIAGRALSLYLTTCYAGLATGSWLWGMIATRIGLLEALTVMGAALVILCGAGIRWWAVD
ncbi:MAG: MFS transporter [Microbacterium sp.]